MFFQLRQERNGESPKRTPLTPHLAKQIVSRSDIAILAVRISNATEQALQIMLGSSSNLTRSCLTQLYGLVRPTLRSFNLVLKRSQFCDKRSCESCQATSGRPLLPIVWCTKQGYKSTSMCSQNYVLHAIHDIREYLYRFKNTWEWYMSQNMLKTHYTEKYVLKIINTSHLKLSKHSRNKCTSWITQ